MDSVKKRGRKKKIPKKVLDFEFVTISEAERRLPYVRNTIYKMIKDGRIESKEFAGITFVKVKTKKKK